MLKDRCERASYRDMVPSSGEKGGIGRKCRKHRTAWLFRQIIHCDSRQKAR